MIDFELRPYPGEDEDAFIKRKAYFIRILRRRKDLSSWYIPKALVNNNKPISARDKELIDAFWDVICLRI